MVEAAHVLHDSDMAVLIQSPAMFSRKEAALLGNSDKGKARELCRLYCSNRGAPALTGKTILPGIHITAHAFYTELPILFYSQKSGNQLLQGHWSHTAQQVISHSNLHWQSSRQCTLEVSCYWVVPGRDRMFPLVKNPQRGWNSTHERENTVRCLMSTLEKRPKFCFPLL